MSRRLLLGVIVLAVLVIGCSDSRPSRNTGDDDVGVRGDLPTDGPEDSGGDGDLGDDGAGLICPPAAGTFGAFCQDADDCSTGFCIDGGGGGRICTDPCLSSCSPLCDGRPTYCRSLLLDDGDVAFVCLPEREDLCAPCSSDNQCANGLCLDFEDGETGCGRDCESASDCPEGYACGDGDPDHDGQCVPDNGTCSCHAGVEGLIRPCAIENDVGVCAGRQFCDADDGWSECDAETPNEELCNGFDDNCDGLVDNGVEVGGSCDIFDEAGENACPGIVVCQGSGGDACLGAAPTTDLCDGFDNDCDGIPDQDYVDEGGRYVLFEHCGACGNTCQERFSLAAEVACDSERDEPACVVVRCQEGYEQVGDTQCVPFQSNVCESCVDDSECNLTSPGAACVTIVDTSDPANVSRVCGRDCSAEGIFGTDCAEGFTCATIELEDETVIDQCVPVAGTCACVDNPAGFTVPCRVTIPDGELAVGSEERGEVSCSGAKSCVGDEFGACELPEDSCDGFDNDCSGRIDDDYRDDPGRYVADEHCGRCNNDCTARFDAEIDNAEGVCDLVDDVPGCAMACLEGFVDLFGGTDDGCECEILSADDLPDDDPTTCVGERCDANCDGVDGDVSVALFVSKTGRSDGAGTQTDPLDSIAAAVSLAAEADSGIRDIYVATGVYSENLVLVDGISLYGGYSFDFFSRDAQQNPTTIFGVLPDPDGLEVGTITARNIASDTVLSGFSIFGFDAPPPPSGAPVPGDSSYAVYLADCGAALRLANNRIVAANGGRGAQGGPGTFGLSGSGGTEGGLGVASDDASCGGVASTPGGGGGTSSCGGAGGSGGAALCPRASESAASYVPCDDSRTEDCLNSCPATGGLTQGVGTLGGNNAGCAGGDCGQSGDPAFDFWSDSGGCGLCGLQLCLRHIGGAGHNGRRGGHGSSGLGCDDVTGSVSVETGLFLGNGGFNGIDDASNGGGGGGGSAGAGYDVLPGSLGCSDNLGGSGGGGGGGGCHGSPGGAGTGGGSSFAVFVFYSEAATGAPTLIDNEIVRGFGGSGGNGGPGGAGGRGGRGAEGGFAFPAQSFCTSPGGSGGNGGGGGAGAGGGGGCGGNAYGLFLFDGPNDFGDDATDWAVGNDFPASGGGGLGGLGGTSIAEDSRGGDGDPGVAVNVVVE